MTELQAAVGTSAPPAVSRAADRRRMIGICVGNFMEWFDFSVYGYFAVAIGAQFFPSGDSTAEVLSSFAVFAVGFAARPVGALVLGPIGDRKGRKALLQITVIGMGISTTLMGLTPSYASIGIAAPILIVLLRCLQGMMAGSEWSSAAAYLVESAPEGRRARRASLLTFSSGVAFMLGTLTALLITSTMSEESANTWGWRIPFVASAVTALIAVYIRKKLEDTAVFHEVARRRAAGTIEPVPWRVQARAVLLTVAFSALGSIGLYNLITYANTHLAVTVGMPRSSALVVCMVSLVLYSCMHQFAGLLCDRWGRRPVALMAGVGLTVVGVPVYLLWDTGNVVLVLLGLVILAFFACCAAVINVVVQVEVFPASIRTRGSALGHNLCQSLIGGTAPLVSAALVAATGIAFSPGVYLAGIALLGTVLVWFMLPETKHVDLVQG
ncbi:MFS transporter [Streptomyces sp. BH106]|uniref:MFS transporter n=1 Tax=Streptomyces sp. BH106 TaxID=3410409 RepID=UPI003CE6F0B2